MPTDKVRELRSQLSTLIDMLSNVDKQLKRVEQQALLDSDSVCIFLTLLLAAERSKFAFRFKHSKRARAIRFFFAKRFVLARGENTRLPRLKDLPAHTSTISVPLSDFSFDGKVYKNVVIQVKKVPHELGNTGSVSET